MAELWAVQTCLVGAIASLVKSQRAYLRPWAGTGVEAVGPETPIAQCSRVFVTILGTAIPSPQA